MPSSPTPTRLILRRAAIGAASLVAAVAFVMTRPWSSRSSWRQMRIFDPAVRVQNFRDMDGLFFSGGSLLVTGEPCSPPGR